MQCQSQSSRNADGFSRTIGRLAMALLVLGVVGCSTLPESGGSLFPTFRSAQKSQAEEESYREKYQQDRDPAAFRWLMKNCVNSGMSPAEIAAVMGESGERIDNDGWLKKDSANFHLSDVTYKWGPDRKGRSALLVFRDGKLINFDPEQF